MPKFDGITFATEAKTLEYANRIREAGGASFLKALLPSVPQEPHACLIAKALNFGCEVMPDREAGIWVMRPDLPAEEIVALAKRARVRYRRHKDGVDIILPKAIGKVAVVFDRLLDEGLLAVDPVEWDYDHGDERPTLYRNELGVFQPKELEVASMFGGTLTQKTIERLVKEGMLPWPAKYANG